MRRGVLAAALLGLGWLAGCTAPRAPQSGAGPTLGLQPAAFADLPGWREDDQAAALVAFRASCAQMDSAGSLGGTGQAASLGGSPALWRPACDAAGTVGAGRDDARRFFEAWLQPYALSNGRTGDSAGLFTGYYEPEVLGSRIASGAFATPLLSRPPDLVQVDLGQFSDDLKGRTISGRISGPRFLPYYDRAEIEAGALAQKRLELLWLADPIDAFVLHIQGSGRVRLPDGKVVRVTYAGQNGRPYVPIGRVLADEGDIPLDQVSMQSIRAWLAAHPDRAAAMMDRNPSYVFFRELDSLPPDQGPPGAMGVPLTPGRSAAVDRNFIPMGAPLYVATTDPLAHAPLDRLLVAQDVGGAIRGPVRADLFWGWDQQAAERAGLMRSQGRAWVLLPRPLRSAAATP